MADYAQYIIYIVEGVFVLSCNIPLTLAIILPKKNRERKEFIFIAGLAVSDTIYAGAFIQTGSRRIRLLDLGIQNTTAERWECGALASNIMLNAGNQLVGLATCAVALDRLIAVLWPVKHYVWGPAYALGVLSIPIVMVAITVIWNLIIVSNDHTKVPIFCLANIATNPDIYRYMNLLRMSCVGLSAVMYIIVAISLKKRQTKSLQLTTIQKANIQRATITMGITTVNAVLFLFLPDFFIYTNYFRLATNFLVPLYCLILTRTCLNFVIIVSRHKELRQGLFRMIYGQRAKPKPTSVAQSIPQTQQSRAASNFSSPRA